jgi:hypothetical protein
MGSIQTFASRLMLALLALAPIACDGGIPVATAIAEPVEAAAPAAPPAAVAANAGWCSHEEAGASVECVLGDQDGAWTCTCSRGGRVTGTCVQAGGVSVNACEFQNCCP